MDKPKYYLTTPIYYANSRPHVGSAYTTIVCDVIARYKRMCGYDVAYLTGTDEHGVNIERAAESQGITPAELVDRNQKIFLELWKLLGISYTDFVRTTSPQHAIAVQNLIRRTQRITPEAIFKRKYEGRYCIYDNLYVSDTPEPANCQICGRPAELISEENYFFRLSAYQDKLLQLYKDNPQFVQPDFRMNEVKSFVESGLKDLSISRKSIKWGIPWPGDPEHVFYVWYDALTSYMSGIGFVDGESKDSAKFKRFWPADVHMIGKEIIRFHAVYWPAFLMASGLPLPKQVFAHGWLLFEQEKMSKSKGNVAYPEPIVKVLGNDALRYYLLRETVFGQDGNFSREALITRYNADLANGLGNLASRVLTMIQNYCDGVIPDPRVVGGQFLVNHGEFVAGFSAVSLQIILAGYEAFGFAGAAEAIWALVASTDKYLVLQKPWTLASDPAQRQELERVLYAAAESIRFVSVLAHPVIPDATQKIWEQLGQAGKLADVRIDQLQWGGLKPGTRIGKPEAVFPRVDKKEASERIEAMEQEIRNPGSAPAAAGSAAPAAAPAADAKITIDDFAKVELRVGVVKSAERIQGADKLLKVLVDIGDEVRQVLAGIATAYAPEDLVGRKVVVVTNLAPRKMRGLESNGMLLAASAGPDGKPVLCTFAEEIPPGAKVK
ncbi:MAG TPA: methionine--tRNA ligase [Candidatus Acidoferrales bacterium]|nr:methionine--tRNA ligase [Candidatus Acidoferrales bacterium]